MTFPLWGWLAFAGLLAVLLTIDLIAHRGGRETSHRAAVAWSVVWVLAGLGFGGFVWWRFGQGAAEDYLGAYLIEKSLSLDNLFVFLVIFQSLGIEKDKQHKVLFWGIFGALVFRAIFIFLGAAALARWSWVTWIFAAILLWAAVRVMREDPGKQEESTAVTWLSRHLPVSTQSDAARFFVSENGRRMVTRLFLAVCGLELTDIVFAVDSVPAAFSVTREPFLVYSSNAFAILGLRALYLVLAGAIGGLRYLHYGLGLVLGFAAVKLAFAQWLHIPPLVSVGIIFVIIGAAILASLSAKRREASARGRMAKRVEV